MKISKLILAAIMLIISLIACTKDNTTEPVVKNPPATPRNLTATNKMYGDKIIINWHKTANTADYKLYRSLNDTLNFNLLATVADTAYIDTTVISANLYYYKVKAQNTDGSSSYSNQAAGSVYRIGHRVFQEYHYVIYQDSLHQCRKRTYHYSADELLDYIQDSIRYASLPQFFVDHRTVFSYDTEKKLISDIESIPVYDGTFSSYRKQEYFYEQNRITSRKLYEWSNPSASWKYLGTKLYTYNESGQLFQIGNTGYNESFYYTGDMIDSSLFFSGGSTPTGKCRFVYSNNLQIRKEYYEYSYGRWVFYGEKRYEYETYIDTSKAGDSNQNNPIIFKREPIARFKR